MKVVNTADWCFSTLYNPQQSVNKCQQEKLNMVICQICKRQNPPRTIACHQCGIQLGMALCHGESTRSQPKDIPLFHFTLTISPTTFYFDAVDTQLYLAIETEIYLGRAFIDSFSHPFLDLQPFNALRFGVSRIHACLQQHHFGQYHIIDLGSSNGTRLNNDLLVAFLQYPVQHNSLIQLAKLPILIQFTDS